jgi:hypothetical protein
MPLFCLARLDAGYYASTASCELCKRGVPLEQVEADEKTEEVRESWLSASV